MTPESLLLIIREGSTESLGSLVNACRRRFLAAADLLEWRSPPLDQLRELGISSPINVWPLVPAYDLIGQRYIEALYQPQRNLFPRGGGEPDEEWWRYFHHVLVPWLLREDAVVRDILRAVGGLPAQGSLPAADAVRHFVAEWTLPSTQPPWAPEDEMQHG